MNAQPSPDCGSAAPPSPDAPTGYRGRAFVYVLVSAGPEDMVKVGLTHDPLQRWSGFHPRWFEAFDLDHSMLVETESRADAQALETGLHRALREHQCPVPLTMRLAAGGGTEWYRGAYPVLRRLLQAQVDAGYIVHWRSREYLAAPMRSQREQLFELLHVALADHHAGALGAVRCRAIRDLFDAHRLFDGSLVQQLPDGLVEDLGLLR